MKIRKINCDAKVYSLENEESNLMKVKLTVVHSGINRNNSSISDIAIEEAIESVKNVPILAYIKKDEEGNIEDFDGHNMETKVVKDEEGFKFETTFLEKPIGVIPESCNPRYEEINGKKYFVIDGYIWKSYSNSAYKLIEDSMFKNVSMEIKVLEGSYNDEEDVYAINKYAYQGITVLGDMVEPGIEGANMITYSKCEDYKTQLEDIYKEIFTVGSEVKNVEIENNITEEEVVIEEAEKVEEVVEVTEVEVTEEVEVEQAKEEIIVEEVAQEETEIEEVKEEEVVETDNTLPFEMFKLLFEEVPNSLEEIAVKLHERIETLNSELVGLRDFKEVKDMEQLTFDVETMLNEFSSLDESEIEGVKAKALSKEIGLEELKKELYCIVGMKALQSKEKFSADKKEDIEVPIMSNFNQDFKDEYNGLISKYL